MAHLNTTSYPAHSKDADNMLIFKQFRLFQQSPIHIHDQQSKAQDKWEEKKERIIRKGKKWVKVDEHISILFTSTSTSKTL